VRLREDLPVSQTEQLGRKLQALLDERWEINHATLQFEVAAPQELPCERDQAGHCLPAPAHAPHQDHDHGHSH
jgi:hypothetical protein